MTDPLTLAREALERISRLDTVPMAPNEFFKGVAQGHDNAAALARAALSVLPEKGEVWWMLQGSPDDAWLLRSRGETDEGARVLVIDYPEGDSRPAGR